MSALWTPGRAGASPGFLRQSPAPPSQVRPLPAQGPGGHGSTPAPPRVGSSRSTPRGSGSTDHGLCVLHEGPTYPKYPQPSSSSTPPSCIAPKRRQQLRAAGPAPPEKRAVAPAHGRPPHQRLEMPRHPKLPEDMRQHSQRHVRRRSPGSAWPRRRRRPQQLRPRGPYRSRRHRRHRAAPR